MIQRFIQALAAWNTPAIPTGVTRAEICGAHGVSIAAPPPPDPIDEAIAIWNDGVIAAADRVGQARFSQWWGTA